jgi:hypothetical protein
MKSAIAQKCSPLPLDLIHVFLPIKFLSLWVAIYWIRNGNFALLIRPLRVE